MGRLGKKIESFFFILRHSDFFLPSFFKTLSILSVFFFFEEMDILLLDLMVYNKIHFKMKITSHKPLRNINILSISKFS